MTQTLLIVLVPPALEDSMVDWLLEQPQLSGFSSSEAAGHGSRVEGLSLLEQVTGRQRRIQFMLHAEAAVVDGLMAQMKTRFAGAGLHYLCLPLAEAGQI